jgi:hypothetical protein
MQVTSLRPCRGGGRIEEDVKGVTAMNRGSVDFGREERLKGGLNVDAKVKMWVLILLSISMV